VGGGMAHAPSCSEPAHRRMQERFTACRSKHARAYHENSVKGEGFLIYEENAQIFNQIWGGR
jgi:hypothetical protein